MEGTWHMYRIKLLVICVQQEEVGPVPSILQKQTSFLLLWCVLQLKRKQNFQIFSRSLYCVNE